MNDKLTPEQQKAIEETKVYLERRNEELIKLATEIGKLVLSTVDKDAKENSEGNVDVDEYITEWYNSEMGTAEELNIMLVKRASQLL